MRRVCSPSYMHTYTTLFIDGIFDHKIVKKLLMDVQNTKNMLVGR